MLDTMMEVIRKTETIFSEPTEIKVPEPSLDYKRKLDALEKANLINQKTALIFDMRCWQAEQIGFKRIESDEMVKMLMGNESTESMPSDGERQNYEWAYNHHEDEEFKPFSWGGQPTIFKRVERQGLWYMPPFAKKEIWRCQFGKLNYLKREIPYGVVLKINECKKPKLFNAFNVLAPAEAWVRKTDIDPIVVGTIWELPYDKDGKHADAGQAAHFFLAQWQ